MTGLLGEAVDEAERLVARYGAVSVDLREIDVVAIRPAKVGDLVDRCRGAVA